MVKDPEAKTLLDWVDLAEDAHPDFPAQKLVLLKDALAFAEARVKEATDKLKQHYDTLKDWFVTYIYETTSSIKSVVFGYGNLVDSDIQLMDCILELERFLEEAKPSESE